MAPPTLIPPKATTLRTSSARAPVAKTTKAVTAAPLVTAATTATGRHQRRRTGSSASRGVTVAVAAATITASTGSTASGAGTPPPAPDRRPGAGRPRGRPTTPPRGPGAPRPPAAPHRPPGAGSPAPAPSGPHRPSAHRIATRVTAGRRGSFDLSRCASRGPGQGPVCEESGCVVLALGGRFAAVFGVGGRHRYTAMAMSHRHQAT